MAAFAGSGPAGTITFPAIPGRACKVEGSTDFFHWTTLTTITADASSVFWTDPDAAALGRRYYRVAIP